MSEQDTLNTTGIPFVSADNEPFRARQPASLKRSVSPPTSKKRRTSVHRAQSQPDTATVEAGRVEVENPVEFFSSKLLACTRSDDLSWPRLTHHEWVNLYQRNLHPRGHHFVVHQHDHPVAGTHYDLRLQCNHTSSISFAIMYGLPGDPNSRRISRNATETRVHNLWNHLIETASHSTGSMLIWDTGEYTVLPYRQSISPMDSDSESRESSDATNPSALSEPEKLHAAFQQRKIRLRLHGTRLPHNYTVFLRLTHDNDRHEQPKPPSRKRKRRQRSRAQTPSKSPSDSDINPSGVLAQPGATSPISPRRHEKSGVTSLYRTASPPGRAKLEAPRKHFPRPPQPLDSGDEDDTIRSTNTYPGGAVNTINSIHQRKWYLSLDRRGCGFVRRHSKESDEKFWIRTRKCIKDSTSDGQAMEAGFQKFYVLGRDVERSVVTGRTAKSILEDEGVEGFVPRGLWRPVTE